MSASQSAGPRSRAHRAFYWGGKLRIVERCLAGATLIAVLIFVALLTLIGSGVHFDLLQPITPRSESSADQSAVGQGTTEPAKNGRDNPSVGDVHVDLPLEDNVVRLQLEEGRPEASQTTTEPTPPAPDRKHTIDPQDTGTGQDEAASSQASDEPSSTGIPLPSPTEESDRSGSEALDKVQRSAGTPTDCLPGELRKLLVDVATRFGTVTLVATHQPPMNNHSRGSAREKLHLACRAVDFTVQDRHKEIMVYLRSRPEVAGLETYRDGVIHVDLRAGLPGASNDGLQ